MRDVSPKATYPNIVATRYVAPFHRCKLDAFENYDEHAECCDDCEFRGQGFLITANNGKAYHCLFVGYASPQEYVITEYDSLKEALDELDCIADEVIPMRDETDGHIPLDDCLNKFRADPRWTTGYDQERKVCTL